MITIKEDDKGIVIDKNGNIALLDGIDALAQDVTSRLLLNQGENPFNLDEGINYQDDILGKFGGEEYVRNIYRERIAESDEITEVQNVQVNRGDNNTLNVSAEVFNIYGVTLNV